MTAGLRFYGFAYCFYNILRCPAALIKLALGRASFPRGKLLYRVGRQAGCFLRCDNRRVPGTAHRPFPTVSLMGGTVYPHRLYMQRFMAMNHRRYIGGTVYCVVPFNHTGYIRYIPRREKLYNPAFSGYNNEKTGR